MPLNYQWQRLKINWRNIKEFNEVFSQWNPKYIVLDTETTGLHLTKDVPFFISLALINSKNEALGIGINLKNISKEDLAETFRLMFHYTKDSYLIAHNLSYDLNMIANIGFECPHRNVLDTMILIRLTTDAIQEKYGGAPLKLKKFASQYIDSNAKYYAKQIDQERTKIAKGYNLSLFKKINKKQFEAKTKFPNDIDDLPENMKSEYLIWLESLPEEIKKNMTGLTVASEEIPYSFIDEDLLETYGIYDAIYTYEIFDRTYPLIEKRHQKDVFEIEQKLAYPLYKITREGFTINTKYLYEVRARMKEYIKERLEKFQELAGQNITVSQAKELLKVLKNKYKLEDLTATNEDVLSQKMRELQRTDKHNPAIEFIDVIFELRTLSKWYSTYLMKFYIAAKQGAKIHTTINSAGTITGRFTSDFQQFPRSEIKDVYGNTLFHPRHLIQRPDNDYYLLFIDYSQMELRLQALYTILLDNPDTNLCRAYMPYLCYHHETKEEFDYYKKEHILRWNEKKEDGTSTWHLKENNTPWVETDVHSQMTARAFPDVERGTDEFKFLRGNVGKHANFACNYGAKAKRIHEMFPDLSWEEAKNLYQAYRDTFPGTIYYQSWCYDTVAANGYGENLFNRRYYNISGHNYINAAIQGTGADLLKIKMIELYNLLEPYKSKLIMTVHDELIFVLYYTEVELIPKLKAIMEELDGTYIPIVVDVEISNTTWAKKKGFELQNGLLTINTR